MALEDALHRWLRPYMAAPQWARSSAGRLYRSLPARLKYGSRYGEFLADAERHVASVQPLEVEARLATTLNHALASVPACAPYADLLHDRRSAFDRLNDLPTCSKAEIKRDLARYLSRAVPPGRRLRMFTGGSTTEPMLFYLERSSSRPKESAYSHWIDRALLGGRRGDWTLSLRGRSVPGAIDGGAAFWITEPIKRHLILSSDHLEAQYMPRYVDALRRLRPRLIHAFPSALYPLCRWLSDHPCPEFTEGVSGVLLTSENVYEFQDAAFRRTFHCPIVRHYGHSERAVLGLAAGSDSHYRVLPLYGYVELLDESDRGITEPAEVGEIVVTSFDNRAMPFIRYRTGDLGVWAARTLPGQPQRTLARIEGRLQEFVVCRDRRLVSITTLGAAHFSELAAVDQIQFEQRDIGHVRLKYVARSALTKGEVAAVEEAIRAKTQGGCDVSVMRVAALERTQRGKLRMIEQHLDLTAYLGASVTPQRERDLLIPPTS